KRKNTFARGVLGESLLERVEGRVLDVLRRVEVRLADRKRDDIFSRCFELIRTLGGGESRRRFDRKNGLAQIQHIIPIGDTSSCPPLFKKVEHTNSTRTAHHL